MTEGADLVDELRPGMRVSSPIGDGRILRRAFGGWEVLITGEVRWFSDLDLTPVVATDD